jgi:hypothetical protein
MNTRWTLLAIILMGHLTAIPVHAASCTRGVPPFGNGDCYCDCVKGSTNPNCSTLHGVGVPHDTSLLACEDFEAPTLHDNVNVGGGAPDWGPPYDDSGRTGARGQNSYMLQNYGSVTGSCAWGPGQPASPALGRPCDPSFTFGCFAALFVAGDPFSVLGSNAVGSCSSVQRNGEYNAENIGIAAPTTVFDGVQSWGYRVPAGPNPGGLGHTMPFAPSTLVTPATYYPTFGITQAVAYPSNSTSSGVWAGPWKHDEYFNAGGPNGNQGLDGPFMFHNQPGHSNQDPFHYMNLFWNYPTYGSAFAPAAVCTASVNGATKNAGDLFCTFDPSGPAIGIQYGAKATDPNHYDQPTDWPDGTWGCVQAYYQNLGSASSSIQIWFTGQSGVQKKIVDISNFDMRWLAVAGPPAGYSAMLFDMYANTNYVPGGGTPITNPTYRYEDNIHIRNGPPVSCAQLGLNSSPPPATTCSGAGSKLALFNGKLQNQGGSLACQ